jgi:hypothetical protein
VTWGYTYFWDRLPGEKKFYDRIPPLLEKKYLKTIYCCHECAGTLKKGDLDADGVLSVLDIDHVLTLEAPLPT